MQLKLRVTLSKYSDTFVDIDLQGDPKMIDTIREKVEALAKENEWIAQ